MSVVRTGRDVLRVVVLAEDTTLSGLTVEGLVVSVGTSLVEDSGRAVGVRVPAVALRVEIDRRNLRVHASETVTGDGEDAAVCGKSQHKCGLKL